MFAIDNVQYTYDDMVVLTILNAVLEIENSEFCTSYWLLKIVANTVRGFVLRNMS